MTPRPFFAAVYIFAIAAPGRFLARPHGAESTAPRPPLLLRGSGRVISLRLDRLHAPFSDLGNASVEGRIRETRARRRAGLEKKRRGPGSIKDKCNVWAGHGQYSIEAK